MFVAIAKAMASSWGATGSQNIGGAVAMLAGKDAHDLIDSHEPTKWREKVLVSDSLASVLQAMLQPKSVERIDSTKALMTAIQTATQSQRLGGEAVQRSLCSGFYRVSGPAA